MGPPLIYPPQPVEIEPGSYPRNPGSYSSWEAPMYPASSVVLSDSSTTNNVGLHKIGPIVLDLAMRSSSQDSLSTWWNGNDAPWVARGIVPDTVPEERLSARGYPVGHRGPPFGVPNRFVNPPDSGSVLYRVPSSDSGYGTILGPESASVRGSDIHDHSPDGQSIAGRVHEFQQFHEGGSSHDIHEAVSWPLISQNPLPFRCETCQKPAKTKSELKYGLPTFSEIRAKYNRKHKLRHTKPFRCPNGSCTRADGFSTSNDLERHVRCKHPDDLPEGRGVKTYRCHVAECKSRGKTWPRLDNFKSHLRRVHGLQDENILEQYVHRSVADEFVYDGKLLTRRQRAVMDQQISKGHLFPENCLERAKEMDQEDPIVGGPDDFPSPWDGDPEWSQDNLSIDRPEMVDPLIELPQPRDLAPSSGKYLIGIGGAQEQADSFPCRASDLAHGCLEKENRLPSADAVDGAVTPHDVSDQGSHGGSSPPENLVDTGKTSKEPTETHIDPCLRDALTALLSSASTRKDVGLNHGSKRPTGLGEADARAAAEVVSCRTAGDLPLPNPADSPAGSPGDQKLGSDTSNAPGCNKSDTTALTDHSLGLILDALKNAGYVLRKDNISHAGSSSTANHPKIAAPKKRDQVSCTICSNFRGRPCEVKKHMKRHDRPYGCTYLNCKKKLGSKNDWKRHENSQHYQHESWRCDEKGEDGASCGKVFYTVDNARAHFIKIHKVKETDVGPKLDQRRINPNNQDLFWCGFCENDIKLTEKGLDAWNQRFNHIDDHFMGRNDRAKQTIAEWKHKGKGMRSSPNSSSSANGEESGSGSSTNSSPSSPNLSESQDPSPPKGGEEKRKRESGDEQAERPAKQSKHGKHEMRIFCCNCHLDFNPRTQAACTEDGHKFCDACERMQVPVHGDHSTERR